MLDFNNFRILLESSHEDDEDSNYNTIGLSQDKINKIKEILLEKLPNLLLIEKSDIDFIGSAGFKENEELSYNLDMIIDLNSIIEKNNIENKTNILEFIKNQLKRLNLDSKINEEDRIIECFWKLEEGESFSILIKPTKSFETAKYFRKKLNESNFNNKYREVFLQAIAKYSDRKIKEYFRIDSPKAYLIRQLDPEKGLYEMERSFIGRHGTLKKSKIISASKKLISNDPRKIMEMLIGIKESERLEDFDTFESLFKKFVSEDFPYPKKRRRIFYEFKTMVEKRNLQFGKTLQELHKKIKEKF